MKTTASNYRPWADLPPLAPTAVSRCACGNCQHFTPDPINPPAGMGRCSKGHGMWHPGAPRNCADFQRITQESST